MVSLKSERIVPDFWLGSTVIGEVKKALRQGGAIGGIGGIGGTGGIGGIGAIATAIASAIASGFAHAVSANAAKLQEW